MEEKRRRLTAKSKSEIVLDIFQGEASVTEISRAYDITPTAIEEWMKEARKGMENQLLDFGAGSPKLRMNNMK
jgi:transposase-like protein